MKKRTKKVTRRKIAKRTKRKNPRGKPDPHMYTNLASSVMRNESVRTFLQNRYGPFFSGMIDTLDVAYFNKLKEDDSLSPKEFIDLYTTSDRDITDAIEDLNDPRQHKEAKEHLKRLIKYLQTGIYEKRK